MSEYTIIVAVLSLIVTWHKGLFSQQFEDPASGGYTKQVQISLAVHVMSGAVELVVNF